MSDMKKKLQNAKPLNPPKQERIELNLRLDVVLHKRASRLKGKDVSLNQFINLAIESACEELEKAKAS